MYLDFLCSFPICKRGIIIVLLHNELEKIKCSQLLKLPVPPFHSTDYFLIPWPQLLLAATVQLSPGEAAVAHTPHQSLMVAEVILKVTSSPSTCDCAPGRRGLQLPTMLFIFVENDQFI